MASARMQSKKSWSGRMTSPNRRILCDASQTCPRWTALNRTTLFNTLSPNRITRQSKHCKVTNAPRRALPAPTRSELEQLEASGSYIEDKNISPFKSAHNLITWAHTHTHSLIVIYYTDTQHSYSPTQFTPSDVLPYISLPVLFLHVPLLLFSS